MVVDSGNIIDDDNQSLRGGRLGVFSGDQDLVTWSALRYRWALTLIPIFVYLTNYLIPPVVQMHKEPRN